MKITKPDFYDSFKCMADKCKDSCCIGWEIDIDEKTFEKYINTDGELSYELKKSICTDGVPHFILKENDRCPFLDGNGLCRLILEGGEELLCDICTEHPRFYEWYGEYKDMGLGLCCEAACELLLENEKPLEYIFLCTEEPSDDFTGEDLCDEAYLVRKKLFGIINDRSIALSERIKRCFAAVGVKDVKAEPSASEVFYEIIEILGQTEPYDDRWDEYMTVLRKCDYMTFRELSKKLLSARKNEYERLFSYFVFRHFIKCVFDEDMLTHLKECILLVLSVVLIDAAAFTKHGSLSFSRRIENTVYLSKQLEYSEENTDILVNECAYNVVINENSLVALLKDLFE